MPTLHQAVEAHPLQEFLEDHEQHLARLRETGRPEVLTVEGQRGVVIQDASAYKKLLDELDLLESAQIIRERLAAIDRGERGVPLDEAFARIRQQLADHCRTRGM